MMKIYGSSPCSFPVGAPQCADSLLRVYGRHVEGQVLTVPAGEVLVVPEHGDWADSSPEQRHEFPTGTRFCVLRAGDPRTLSITEIL